MVLPTVANAVTSSVPPGAAGVAAGVDNALRALGGVFGVAIAAAVFTRYGGPRLGGVLRRGVRTRALVSAGAAAAGAMVRRSHRRAPGLRARTLPALGARKPDVAHARASG